MKNLTLFFLRKYRYQEDKAILWYNRHVKKHCINTV